MAPKCQAFVPSTYTTSSQAPPPKYMNRTQPQENSRLVQGAQSPRAQGYYGQGQCSREHDGQDETAREDKWHGGRLSAVKEFSSHLCIDPVFWKTVACFTMLILFCLWAPGVWRRNVSALRCDIPDDGSPSVYRSYAFNPTNSTNLQLTLDDSVFGRVLITEADNADIRDINVRVHISTSVPHVLEDIRVTITSNSDEYRLTEVLLDLSNIHETTRGQLRYRHCARVNVEIIYPIQQPQSAADPIRAESLKVKAFDSHIIVDLHETIFQNRLSLASTDARGQIELVSAASAKLTELSLTQGMISGRLATRQTVHANVQGKGEIVLDIDGMDKRVSSDEDTLRALDVAVKTSQGGPIYVRVFTPVPYQGHFNLLHTDESFLRRSSQEIPMVLTKNTKNQMAGFIAEGGQEPNTLLSNVELNAVGSGEVSLEFIG